MSSFSDEGVIMELLLPVGSVEALYAAVEGGADAVYLGLDRFNARGRAKNFSKEQFLQALVYAHSNNVKVYLTLNTLVKNNELDELVDLLAFIEQTDVDAVIIQDWGVYWIARKYFPGISLHASTQMGIHNSCGSVMADRFGFTRIVLARELTYPEVKAVCQAAPIEIEVFVHGALCYSFSGSCLFSSWVGGMSANRGLCRQPCRRMFQTQTCSKDAACFSMADLQLVDHLEQLKNAGVASLKIEGRMKPAEYVYRVSRAYRIALDNPDRVDEGRQILEFDYARDKTGYFFGGSVRNSISKQSFVGKLAGTVFSVSNDSIEIKNCEDISIGDRIRVQPASGVDMLPIKVQDVAVVNPGTIRIRPRSNEELRNASIGDNVYIVGTGKTKFPSRFKDKIYQQKYKRLYGNQRDSVLESVYGYEQAVLKHDEILVRLDSITWLSKINPDLVDAIVFDLSLDDLEQIEFSRPFIRKNMDKIVVSLPLLVFESDVPRVRKLVQRFRDSGCSTFMVQQLWQLPIVEGLRNIGIWASENVYTMNDAAIAMLKSLNVERYILPLENDFINLEASRYTDGIFPLYYHPKVFTSRMPALKKNEVCEDSTGSYTYDIKDGISSLYPVLPVSLFHKRQNLMNLGYRCFLIDFSSEKASSNSFQRILKAYHEQIPIQPSTTYNYKNGLH